MFQMPDRMKKGIASLALAGSLLGATVGGAAAATPHPVQVGGAKGLVAAVIQATNVLNNNTIEVVTIDSSFNNLRALNNVLNNSPILNNFLNNNNILQDITVGDVTVLNDVVTVGNIELTDVQVGLLQNFLNANQLTLDDVVGAIVLSTGDLLVFV